MTALACAPRTVLMVIQFLRPRVKFRKARSVNQEEYLKLFLTDGEIPIDDSASERALRNFTLGRKNWMKGFVCSRFFDRLLVSLADCLDGIRKIASGRTVWSAERYFTPVYEYMKARQLQAHVNQCDETTVEVIHDAVSFAKSSIESIPGYIMRNLFLWEIL